MLLLKKLFQSIARKGQIKTILLILEMPLSSVTELISIALYAPFISIILGNKEILEGNLFSVISKYLENNNLILLIITIFLLSGSIRIVSLFWQNQFAARVNNEIIYKAYNVILNEVYPIHINKSKSNLISIVHTFGNYLLTEVIIPILKFTFKEIP